MSKPWGGYIRVSTKQQIDGFSLDHQKEKLESFAAEEGRGLLLFEDRGVSGETLDRPGLVELLEAVALGTISAVVVIDETRLGRKNLVVATILDQLERAGVPLAIPGRGIVDLSDPNMALMVEILGSVASLEQKVRTQKTSAGHRKTAEAGYWPGGPAPYGYDLIPSEDSKHTVLAINDEEKDVLRLAADLIVNKRYTTYTAANHLNALGIRTQKDRPWRHENLSGQLRKPHTAGLYVYRHKGQGIAFDIPHIFTQEEWDQLQGAIKGTPRPNRKNRLYPLTGKGRSHLRCVCGGNFSGFSDRSSKKGPMYECSNNNNGFGEDRCPHRPRATKAEALDDAVWKQVILALTDSDYLTDLATSHLSSATGGDETKRVGGLRTRLANLQTTETNIVRRLAEGGDLHGDALERALEATTRDRATVEKELSRTEKTQRGKLTVESVPDAALRLKRLAEARLATPTTALMAEVFDLLEVNLTRTEGRRFEGVARIPLPDTEQDREVWEGVLPGP